MRSVSPVRQTCIWCVCSVDAQLDFVTARFMNDPQNTWLEGNRLHVSRIFKWFREDWGNDKDVIAFVRQYARDGLAEKLAGFGNAVELNYQEYDWSLNDSGGL